MYKQSHTRLIVKSPWEIKHQRSRAMLHSFSRFLILTTLKPLQQFLEKGLGGKTKVS